MKIKKEDVLEGVCFIAAMAALFYIYVIGEQLIYMQ